MTRSVGVLFALLGLCVIGSGFWLTTGLLQARVAEAAAALAETRAEAAALTARIAEFRTADVGAALPADLTLPETGAAEAVVGLQERLVTLARAHGVDLTTLTAGTAPAGLSLPAAALTVEGEGRLTDVLAFLDALERQPPRLGLSHLTLSSREATGWVSLRLTAWGVLDGGAG